jgi:hypothetical protein
MVMPPVKVLTASRMTVPGPSTTTLPIPALAPVPPDPL